MGDAVRSFLLWEIAAPVAAGVCLYGAAMLIPPVRRWVHT